MAIAMLLTVLFLLPRAVQASAPAAGQRDGSYLVQRYASAAMGDAPTRSVALCVTGTLARFQPEHLVNNFVKASPQFHFDVIYVFEDNPHLYFSTEAGVKFAPSSFANLTQDGVKEALKKVYRGVHNADVHVLPFVPKKSAAAWQGYFGLAPGRPLDRIVQYTNIQPNLLDMYHKHAVCGSHVVKLEAERRQHFHAVVSTREDIYLFKPLPLEGLLASHPGCDYIGKNCLDWGGVNMRMQVLSRHALDFIRGRLTFYRGLLNSGKNFHNPESFEQGQAASLGMKVCKAPISEFPATAARPTVRGDFCFINAEVMRCIPDGYDKFVQGKICH